MNQNEIKITDLIDRENMKSDPSFGYWNDSNKEKKKAFNVEVGFDRPRNLLILMIYSSN